MKKRASVALRSVGPAGLIVALAWLSGCSTVSRGSLDAIRLAVHGETVDATAASVAATPYFQLQVSAPGGQAILILGDTSHGALGWYGADHTAVYTRQGVISRTVGLPQNLDGSAFVGPNPFEVGLQHLQKPVTYVRRMDWSPGYRYNITITARLVPRAAEDIDILGTVHHVRRYDEELQASDAGFHVTNRYWADAADGFVWKSEQYVAPGYRLELIQLRPYREGSP